MPPGGLPFLRIDKRGGAWVEVVVASHASRTHATGMHGEPGRKALRVRLKAIPDGGKANDALINWLAGCLDIPRKTITLVRGESSRQNNRVSVRRPQVSPDGTS
jgi:uncharacterized protein